MRKSKGSMAAMGEFPDLPPARKKKWLINPKHFLVLLILSGIWEFIIRMEWVDPLLLPGPVSILTAFWKIIILQGLAWHHFGTTLLEAIIGFLIGCLIGFSLAIACAFSKTFRRYLTPYIIWFQVTPRIAFAPIIIAWMGFGISSKIVFVITICFFFPYINMFVALLNVDKEAMEMFKSLQASKKQVFSQLMIPSALPEIMAGIKTAMTMALIAAIVGEFISAKEGLGPLIKRFTLALNMPASFAVLMLLCLMGLLLYVLMGVMDYRLVFWKHDKRMNAISRKQSLKYRIVKN